MNAFTHVLFFLLPTSVYAPRGPAQHLLSSLFHPLPLEQTQDYYLSERPHKAEVRGLRSGWGIASPHSTGVRASPSH